jgi:two-component system sensor histidine kinase ChvG
VRLRVGVAARLLLAASPLLLLPWTSLALARHLRRAGVATQREALAATARRTAAALSDRTGLLRPGDDGASRVLRLLELTQPIVPDGRASDWDAEGVEPLRLPEPMAEGMEPPAFSAVVRIGVRDGGVYVLTEVRDLHVVLRDAMTAAPGDQIELAVVTADDDWLRFAIDAPGDGPVTAWLLGGDGSRVPDNRVEGTWRTAEGGYTVELRLPRTLVGSRLGIAVVDVEDPQSRAPVARLETSAMDSRDALASVETPSPADSAMIEALAGPGVRLWLVDTDKHVVAHAGALRADVARSGPAVVLLRALGPVSGSLPGGLAEGPHEAPVGDEVGRALAGAPAGRWRVTGSAVVLSAAHPVRVEGQVRGAVLVEETARDAVDGDLARALVLVLAAAFLGALVLLGFAARLSLRLRRLAGGVERLKDDARTPPTSLPETKAADEIGDLARGLSSLASRQREHAAYLEQVGRRLSHEMRTPVGVIRTSLDNLGLVGVPDAGRVYLGRADEGVRRLSVILSRLSEATRLEQALAGTERETYDVVPVVCGCVEGYRASRPGSPIVLRVPEEALPLSGSPELLAQLLDKLVDNALGFARPGTAVEVDLTRYGRTIALSVRNEGPPLPAEMQGRLFESMVSIRKAVETAPHLGLGLYIVRLVAEFHGGSVAAHDRPDGRGVIVTATLPLAASDPSWGAPGGGAVGS